MGEKEKFVKVETACADESSFPGITDLTLDVGWTVMAVSEV
jgi:hypothetical protein